MENDTREWSGNYDPIADADDRRVLFAALDSFAILHGKRQSFYALPLAHWQSLAEPPVSMLETFNHIEHALNQNALIAYKILDCGLAAFGLQDSRSSPRSDEEAEKDTSLDWRGSSTPSDFTKATTIIRQLYRDWSSEGSGERLIYSQILSTLEAAFPASLAKHKVRVLVPGAGVGRLAFDLCAAGYDVEGNEISYHALLASSFMLNHCSKAEEFNLYPWTLSFSNHLKREHQLACVKIPDIHPGRVLAEKSSHGNQGSMSMSASDFCVSYREESSRDSFEAVVTVFFIDTAPNFLRYLEAVTNCLRQGGVWINAGPLLWHFESDSERSSGQSKTDDTPLGIGEAGSVELTNEEIMMMLKINGFKVEKFSENLETGYIQNPNSMLQSRYRLSLWAARKL